jgi:hypothetical protein
MRYKIFGKCVEIQIERHKKKERILKELSLYERSEDSPDLLVEYVPSIDYHQMEYNAPKPYFELESWDVFHTTAHVAFHKESPRVIFTIPEEKANLKALRKRFAHIGFETMSTSFGQTLHETVLIPAILRYFSNELCPFHGSALFSEKTGKAVIFSGLGGVGKTSLEMGIMQRGGYRFLCDDLCLVSRNGTVYANFNWPKIYAYNLSLFPQMKTQISRHDSILGKIQWMYKSALKKPVRRRISPEKLYSKPVCREAPLGKIFFLHQDNTRLPGIDKPDRKWPEIFLSIICDELYHVFFRFLQWKELRKHVEDNGEESLLERIRTDLENGYRILGKNLDGIYLFHSPKKFDINRLTDILVKEIE